ncbi:MAG: rhodanese-like domain-containing protein [Sphaerochaetaceae bacterium]|jgi:rhodanese-related sulfurtransferase|nr:rhodanese-like domain-containing protein [Sphaerochaetaceae bacterium]NLO61386.1 hypothetical protein [Spirochaetales bacterium]MDD2405136.1 rhodanese-like domain-containing protein [Sphaerochaetaceae bacterium]MDD3671150.1 rhodanese-like domain-containing protein [Sphaerochaetaceae bacterium]MDD4258912.1 rhodanese-like domain-containing protein [Sphaerochaetaceae bacterium]
MKKRFWAFAIVLVLVVVIGLTGCGKKAEAPTQAAAPAPTTTTVAPAVQPAVTQPAAPAIDKDAVLVTAAKDFFAQIAQSNNMISAKDLKTMLDDNPQAVFIVDIRSGADFEAGHIEGAFHSDWAKLGDVMEKIPQNRQVVVACYSGQTAGQAVATLRFAGFTNVKSLQGGMNNGWKAAELPVTGTGANELSARANVSSPKDAEQEVLWEAAKANFVKVGTDGNKIIKGQDVSDQLDVNPKAFKVFDIRSQEAFDAGHIAGAVFVPWAQFGGQLDSLSKSDKIVIACFSGQTSGQTVGILRTLGYDAYSLSSGMTAGWINANLPVVTK